MLIARKTFNVNQLLHTFNHRFKFGTLVHGPGKLLISGFSIVQNEDYTCTIDGDDKLFALKTTPLTRLRRKEVTTGVKEL